MVETKCLEAKPSSGLQAWRIGWDDQTNAWFTEEIPLRKLYQTSPMSSGASDDFGSVSMGHRLRGQPKSGQSTGSGNSPMASMAPTHTALMALVHATLTAIATARPSS